jgi:hypothetical protein
MIGGSGNGEQNAPNKIPGIRDALALTRQMPRQHTDANVLTLGARMYPVPEAPGPYPGMTAVGWPAGQRGEGALTPVR